MNIVWENKEENFIKAEKAVIEAVEKGAEVLFLPEMSFTGFSMNIGFTAENNNYTVNRIKSLCKKYNIAIGFGWTEKCGNKAKNCYTVLDKNAEELSTYVKIHPFSYGNEDKYFVKGTELSKYNINGIDFSTAICYDVRFPELFQGICKDESIKAVVIPANWPAKRAEHWKALVRARAIENQVYIIAVNCVGDIGKTEYSGDSCVISPNGDIKEYMGSSEGVCVAELVYDIDKLRKNFPVKQDRQVELYKKIL